jgi:hypothetical protein
MFTPPVHAARRGQGNAWPDQEAPAPGFLTLFNFDKFEQFCASFCAKLFEKVAFFCRPAQRPRPPDRHL